MRLDLKAIGSKIRQERKKLGMSRGQLAEMIGVSEYYVGQLERGERVMSLPVFAKLAWVLRVSPDYLLAGCLPRPAGAVCEPQGSYLAGHSFPDGELLELLNRCTQTELEFIKSIIRLVLAYTSRLSPG